MVKCHQSTVSVCVGAALVEEEKEGRSGERGSAKREIQVKWQVCVFKAK